jgi:hypothetical protein
LAWSVAIVDAPAVRPAQPSLGGFGAAALEISTSLREMDANLLDRCFSIGFAVAVGCNDDAEVNAVYLGHCDQCGIIHVTPAGEILLAARIGQIDFTLSKGAQPPLMLSGDAGDLLPTGNRLDRDGLVVNETKDAIVIGLSTEASERAVRISVKLIGVSNLGDKSHNRLSRKIKYFAPFPETSFFRSNWPNRRASHALAKRKLQTCVAKRFLLLANRFQLNVVDQLHMLIYGSVVLLCQPNHEMRTCSPSAQWVCTGMRQHD